MLLESLDLDVRNAALRLQAELIEKVDILDVELEFISSIKTHRLTTGIEQMSGSAIMLHLRSTVPGMHNDARLVLCKREEGKKDIYAFGDSGHDDEFVMLTASLSTDERFKRVIDKALGYFIVFPEETGYDSQDLRAAVSYDKLISVNDALYKLEPINHRKLREGVEYMFITNTAQSFTARVTCYVKDGNVIDSANADILYVKNQRLAALYITGFGLMWEKKPCKPYLLKKL